MRNNKKEKSMADVLRGLDKTERRENDRLTKAERQLRSKTDAISLLAASQGLDIIMFVRDGKNGVAATAVGMVNPDKEHLIVSEMLQNLVKDALDHDPQMLIPVLAAIQDHPGVKLLLFNDDDNEQEQEDDEDKTK